MKLKGITTLNKAISAQLKPFGISEANLSDEYAYSFVDESISFKVTENGMEDKLFTQFVKERFNYETYPFILSLLHEVGHHKANDEIEGAIYDFCTAEKDRITLAINEANTIEEVERLEYQYFNLPDEIMATQWAVNFAKKHPKKIQTMWEKSKQALFKFYEENGIFDGLDDEESEV